MHNDVVVFFARIYKKVKVSRGRAEYNVFVKEYYNKNKGRNCEFVRNIWSKNYLWDYFLQSLPHSVKSEYYVPADYYAFDIEPKLNKEFTCFCMEKNMFEKMFANCGVKMPNTILRCMNNIYLDKDYKVVNDVRSYCETIGEDIIVKPTVQSGGGGNIRKYFFREESLWYDNHNEFNIDEVHRFYNGNFIIQSIVNQDSEIAQFHPHSLNTIRALSYRSVRTNKVHVTIAMFRMGINGSYLDNASIDGIACGIKENGNLMEYAFDQSGNHYVCHPNTMKKFTDFTVPSFSRVVEDIEKLANIIPHQRLVGWDFGIDEHRNPVLIELNIGTGTWMLQIANGRPMFGAYSQEVKDFMDSIG